MLHRFVSWVSFPRLFCVGLIGVVGRLESVMGVGDKAESSSGGEDVDRGDGDKGEDDLEGEGEESKRDASDEGDAEL